MGKGDKKTRRGKIASGSFGKTRPHKKKKTANVSSGEKEKSSKPTKK